MYSLCEEYLYWYACSSVNMIQIISKDDLNRYLSVRLITNLAERYVIASSVTFPILGQQLTITWNELPLNTDAYTVRRSG